MALKEYLGATGLTDILTKLKTWVLGEVPKAIPAGGTTGQVLKKASNTDRDVTWGNASSGGGHTIVDGSGNDMDDEDDLQFVGLSVTDDSTNGRTVVDASGKMNTDGSNATNHVKFSGSFTIGSRLLTADVGTNSFAQGNDTAAPGNYSSSVGTIGSETINDATSNLYFYVNYAETMTQIIIYSLAADYTSRFYGRRIEITVKNIGTRAGLVIGKSTSGTSSVNRKYMITILLEKSFGTRLTTGNVIERIHYAPANMAFGDYSHAKGLENYAKANLSYAEGSNTIARRELQHVQGAYNVGKTNTLFEIGNGTSAERKNIFEVDEDGNVAICGSGTVNTHTFHIANTAAATNVAWCNKIAKFSANNRAVANTAFTFSVTVKLGENVTSLAFDNDVTITSISLFDAATVKINALASANYSYTASVDDKNIVLTFTIAAATMTATNVTAINAVIDSASPGFSCVYAASNLNLTGKIKGQGITEAIPGLPIAMNALAGSGHKTLCIGDFYFPTGGPRWNLELEVDPGTAYMAICYLENTTTGAYFNHSICYAGVPSITLAGAAPAPPAGKVIAFVGTTWTPFVAGVAGVVTDGVLTTKQRLRIQGYNASNTPTAGLGMHMRLFRIY